MNRSILIIHAACVLSVSSCDQQRNEQTEQRAVRPTTPKSLREQLTGLWFGCFTMLGTEVMSSYWIQVGETDSMAFLKSPENVIRRKAFRLQDSLLLIEGWNEEMMIDDLTDSTFHFGPKHGGDTIRVSVPTMSTMTFHRIR
ncbi:MAG TPA: hypothetical protein DIS79_04635 [Bacteroidetes bacterium]|nr:hypothetical protein [Bacteroidota bacterium]HRK04450.1 hypothetical protein [Chlorobiota bacterium]